MRGGIASDWFLSRCQMRSLCIAVGSINLIADFIHLTPITLQIDLDVFRELSEAQNVFCDTFRVQGDHRNLWEEKHDDCF